MFKVSRINRFSYKSMNRFRLNSPIQTDSNYYFSWTNGKSSQVNICCPVLSIYSFQESNAILTLNDYLYVQFISLITIPPKTLTFESTVTVTNQTTNTDYLCDVILYGKDSDNKGRIYLKSGDMLLFPPGTYYIPGFSINLLVTN